MAREVAARGDSAPGPAAGAPAAGAEISGPPAPFIVGAGRSGTTLLRFILDAHPELAIPPETAFLPELERQAPGGTLPAARLVEVLSAAPTWPDFSMTAGELAGALPEDPIRVGEGLRAFYRAYARRQGKPRWGDKTPVHSFHMALIREHLPEARFVHLLRDGRDVAASVRGLWFSPGSTMEEIAASWVAVVTEARRQAPRLGHYLEIRYEDLVLDPWTVLRRVCDFVELDFHPAMERFFLRVPGRLEEHRTRLRPDGTVLISHEGRVHNQRYTMRPVTAERIGRHRTELTAAERRRYESVAGPLLRELGYATDP